MYHTIKVLIEQGRSIRSISRELHIDRKTVSRIYESIKAGKASPEAISRIKKLSTQAEKIIPYFEEGWSAVLIHQELRRQGVEVSYPSVARFVESLKAKEVFVPMHSAPGDQAQVDFGYFGVFIRHGQPIKVWVFGMVLSHSRHAYYSVVTNQKVETFLRCHMQAFDYFGGVPKTIKLDNLASGVLQSDIYDPIIQETYAAFLAHYGSCALPSPVRRPEDKGKIEAGIKYVKNNFLKSLKSRDWDHLVGALHQWNEEIASMRVHGTTRKVPREVFEKVEKHLLLKLPLERYEIREVTSRKVSQQGHIQFHHNYYSVPFTEVGKIVRLESNGNLLRVFKDQTEVCLHELDLGAGQYITREEHKPVGKRDRTEEYYREQVRSIGSNALQWIEAVKMQSPYHWINMARGIIHLKKVHSNLAIDQSCKRAFDFGLLRYQKVRRIIEKDLWREPSLTAVPTEIILGGFGHDLALYDRITQ